MSEMPTPEPALEGGINDVLDIQHDPYPAQDEGKARRTPNLGHTLLFLGLAVVVFVGLLLLAAAALRSRLRPGSGIENVVSLGVEAATYVVTLGAAFYVFPPIWKRSFLRGIHWNGLVARRRWTTLVAIGVALSALAQLGEHFVKEPKSPEIEKLMHTPAGAWSVMLLGTLLAPLMEEIAFRGFLLPSLAIAYDWLSLDRTAEAVRRWENTTSLSNAGLIFGALFSSLLFAGIHAPQLEYAWGPVALLFLVSLVLSAVRVRSQSVACSTLVHLTYNGTIFVAALVATGGFRHLERL